MRTVNKATPCRQWTPSDPSQQSRNDDEFLERNSFVREKRIERRKGNSDQGILEVPALNARGDNKFLKESMGGQRRKTVDVEGLYMV